MKLYGRKSEKRKVSSKLSGDEQESEDDIVSSIAIINSDLAPLVKERREFET
jgi:hypothetical protein